MTPRPPPGTRRPQLPARDRAVAGWRLRHAGLGHGPECPAPRRAHHRPRARVHLRVGSRIARLHGRLRAAQLSARHSLHRRPYDRGRGPRRTNSVPQVRGEHLRRFRRAWLSAGQTDPNRLGVSVNRWLNGSPSTASGWRRCATQCRAISATGWSANVGLIVHPTPASTWARWPRRAPTSPCNPLADRHHPRPSSPTS
jgi:hypothetical protein